MLYSAGKVAVYQGLIGNAYFGGKLTEVGKGSASDSDANSSFGCVHREENIQDVWTLSIGCNRYSRPFACHSRKGFLVRKGRKYMENRGKRMYVVSTHSLIHLTPLY